MKINKDRSTKNEYYDEKRGKYGTVVLNFLLISIRINVLVYTVHVIFKAIKMPNVK